MSKKLEELISLLYQDKLTQYGKRLLVENIEKLQNRIQELEKINTEHQKLNGELREEIKQLKKQKNEILDYIIE